MMVSHTDPRSGVTTTIRVHVVRDLFWSIMFTVGGISLMVWALTVVPPLPHPGMPLVLSAVVTLLGVCLLRRTAALILRAARAYNAATQ